MTVGEKIRKIRLFREMSQKELGLAVGLGEQGAKRIVQYEINYRVPKADLLSKMAEVLHVSFQNFYSPAPGSLETFIFRLLWLEEEFPDILRLFQLRRNANQYGLSDHIAYYTDGDDWPTREPVGIYFDSLLVDDFLQEWLLRKQELYAEQITYEEYFEWKLNWPNTCDDCGKHEPAIPWRKQKQG